MEYIMAKKSIIPPRPKGFVNSIFWMLTYYTAKLLALVVLIALTAYLILCFRCEYQGAKFKAGSQPIDAKVNINK